MSANTQTWPTPESHLDTHAVEPKNSILRSSAVKEAVFSTIKSFSASSAKCRNVRPTIPHHKSPSAVVPFIIIQRISQIHQLFCRSFFSHKKCPFFSFVYFPVSSLLSLSLSVSVCRCVAGKTWNMPPLRKSKCQWRPKALIELMKNGFNVSQGSLNALSEC